jgi:glycosyltransferase involved in cell wall biosynthesis
LTVIPTHFYGQFLFPAGSTAARLFKKTGAKSIVDLGESYLSFYEDHLGLAEVRRAINDVDRVVVVADHLREKCINFYGVPEHKVATFKNAAFIGDGPLDRVNAREQLGLPQDRRIVGFVGTFDENKRPRYVLNALRQRPDIGAFFLGRQGTQTPTGDQVLFAGAVPHEMVPAWLSAADVFVHASLTEMSANAIAEAKACGLPIVATDIPGNRELLDSECALFVAPQDQDTLSNAVFQLMDDPKKRAKMSAAALASAQRYTSLDRARNILSWILS